MIVGTALDKADNSNSSSVQLKIDTTPPALSITSPAAGSSVSTAELEITGTAADSGSGLASVNCGSAAATLNGSTFTCAVTLAVGVNSVPVVASDVAGNSTSTSLSVTFAQIDLNPPPSALYVTPATYSLNVYEEVTFEVIDDRGRSIPVSWRVGDEAVLAPESGNSFAAVAPGATTVTATYGGLTATAQVQVFDGDSLPEGAVRWSVPPMPNRFFKTFLQAQPAPGAPSVYSIETASTGALIRAYTGQGKQLWSAPLGRPTQTTTATSTLSAQALTSADPQQTELLAAMEIVEAAERAIHSGASTDESSVQAVLGGTDQLTLLPSGVDVSDLLYEWMRSGGKDSDAPVYLAQLAQRLQPTLTLAVTRTSGDFSTSIPAGSEEFPQGSVSTNDGGIFLRTLTFVDSPFSHFVSLLKLGPDGTEKWRNEYPATTFGPFWAIHEDGTIFVIERTNSFSRVLALDDSTGATKFVVDIPSSYRCFNNIAGPIESITGPPMIGTDGAYYLQYNWRSYSNSCSGMDSSQLDYHEKLVLLKIMPDGSTSSVNLSQTDYDGPGSIAFGTVLTPYIYNPATTSRDYFPQNLPAEIVPLQDGSLLAFRIYTDSTTSWADAVFNHEHVKATKVAEFVPGNTFEIPELLANGLQSAVVGESGEIYAATYAKIARVDPQTEQTVWTWDVSAGRFFSSMYAMAPDGITTVLASNNFGPDQLIQINGSGTAVSAAQLSPRSAILASTAQVPDVSYNQSQLSMNTLDWLGIGNSFDPTYDGALAMFVGPTVPTALSHWFASAQFDVRAADPGFSIFASIDYHSTNDQKTDPGLTRYINYSLFNPGTSSEKVNNFVLFEHQTARWVPGCTDPKTGEFTGEAPCSFENNDYLFEDQLSASGIPKKILSKQTFNYGSSPTGRRYPVRKIERTLCKGGTPTFTERKGLSKPVLIISLQGGYQPLVNGHIASYMAPWVANPDGPVCPPEAE